MPGRGLPAALSFALPEIEVHVVATARAAAGSPAPTQVVDWRGGAPEVSRVVGDTVDTTVLTTSDGLAASLRPESGTVLIGPRRLLPELAQWLRRTSRVDVELPIEELLDTGRAVGPAGSGRAAFGHG